MKDEILRRLKRRAVGLVIFVLLYAVIKYYQQLEFGIGDVGILFVITILHIGSAIFKAKVAVLRKEDEQIKKGE